MRIDEVVLIGLLTPLLWVCYRFAMLMPNGVVERVLDHGARAAETDKFPQVFGRRHIDSKRQTDFRTHLACAVETRLVVV